ncbi:MAG: hypothetical protein QOK67_07305, partial [Nitrososphaeraceae archaeon]|nr:hypothetical protein [Nitrososphaeraceae archaeon]
RACNTNADARNKSARLKTLSPGQRAVSKLLQSHQHWLALNFVFISLTISLVDKIKSPIASPLLSRSTTISPGPK